MSYIVEKLDGPGITHIFAHHVTSLQGVCLQAVFGEGYSHFDERALLLARPGDVVCIAGQVDRAYLEFLWNLGLGPKSGHLISAGIDTDHEPAMTLPELLLQDARTLRVIGALVPKASRVVLNTYSVSSLEQKLASELGKVLGRSVGLLGGYSPIVDLANLKHQMHNQALALEIPVAPGEIVKLQVTSNSGLVDVTPIKQAIERHVYYTGSVIVRGTNGASGSATVVIQNDSRSLQTNLQRLSEMRSCHTFLVQVMFIIIVSPNVQMFIDSRDGDITCISATDQCLDEACSHVGNVFPSQATMLNKMIGSARTFAEWLRVKGYTGVVGFDFVEYDDPRTGQREYILAEVNARTNAAIYPMAAMKHLNAIQAQRGRASIQACRSEKFFGRAISFSEMERAYRHLFFDSETGRGVVPYNTGCLKKSRWDIVFMGRSPSDVEALCNEFSSLGEEGGKHP